MINRLKINLIAINMALVTIVLFVTFVAVYASTNEQISRDTQRALLQTLNEREVRIPPKIEIGGPMPHPGTGEAKPPAYITTFAVQLDDSHKITKIFAENISIVDQVVLDQMIAACLASDHTSGVVADGDFRFLRTENELGTKIAFADRSEEIHRLTALLRTSGLVGLGSLTAFFLISLFLAQWAVKPIAKSWEQQSQFVADASHELKTPLTTILANTDILLANPDKTVAEQRKWIGYIQTEAERMSSLVNNLLFLAKTDDNQDKLELSQVNFSDTVWSSILPIESVAYEQGKRIENRIGKEIILNGDANKLKQLVLILLDNAIKYTLPQGLITVTLAQETDRVLLTVNNTGEPIPAAQLEHIFERFYRADESRSRVEGGYGLGLAIAAAIVTAHQGKIAVTSNAADGTTFTVTLPQTKK